MADNNLTILSRKIRHFTTYFVSTRHICLFFLKVGYVLCNKVDAYRRELIFVPQHIVILVVKYTRQPLFNILYLIRIFQSGKQRFACQILCVFKVSAFLKCGRKQIIHNVFDVVYVHSTPLLKAFAYKSQFFRFDSVFL